MQKLNMKNLIILYLIMLVSVGCSLGTKVSGNSTGSIIGPSKLIKGNDGIFRPAPVENAKTEPVKTNPKEILTNKETSALPPLPILKTSGQNRVETIAKIDWFLQTEIHEKTEQNILEERPTSIPKAGVVPVLNLKEQKITQNESNKPKEPVVKIHWVKLFLYYFLITSLAYSSYICWKNREKIKSFFSKKTKLNKK